MEALVRRLSHCALGLLVGAAASPSPAADANPSRFVGTWISEGGEYVNITTLRADGRFHTERLLGVEPQGTIDGRWQVRGGAFVWTYEAPPASEEDVNVILTERNDRFTVREADGSSSTFFRKGLADPEAPDLLPVAVGAGWQLQDAEGELTIRVTVRETFAGRDCYRVDWIAGPLTYQSEYWVVAPDGIRVAGRRIGGRPLEFAQTYLLLGRRPRPGDTWTASISAGRLSDTVTFSVGAEENVATPAGSFRALPVTARGELLEYRRWYAPGVGLVREDTGLGEGLRLNTKSLRKRLE